MTDKTLLVIKAEEMDDGVVKVDVLNKAKDRNKLIASLASVLITIIEISEAEKYTGDVLKILSEFITKRFGIKVSKPADTFDIERMFR